MAQNRTGVIVRAMPGIGEGVSTLTLTSAAKNVTTVEEYGTITATFVLDADTRALILRDLAASLLA